MKYQAPTGSSDLNAAYVGKNPILGIVGSKVPPKAIEQPMRELVALIEASGLVTTDSELVQVLRAVRSQRANYLVAGGTANAVTLAPAPVFASLAELVGVPLRFAATAPPTGAVTVNVNGLGAVALTSSDAIALGVGSYKAGQVLEVIYDGTAFRLIAGVSIPRAGGSTTLAPLLATCEARQSSNIAVPTSVDTLLTYGTPIGNSFPASTWNGSRFTVGASEGGYYALSGSWVFATPTTGVFSVARVKKNGATIIAESSVPNNVSGGGVVMTAQAIVRLAVGDYVEVFANHQSGSTQNAIADLTHDRSRFSAQLVASY